MGDKHYGAQFGGPPRTVVVDGLVIPVSTPARPRPTRAPRPKPAAPLATNRRQRRLATGLAEAFKDRERLARERESS